MTKQKVSLFDQEELAVSYNAWGKLAHTNCLNQPVRRFSIIRFPKFKMKNPTSKKNGDLKYSYVLVSK